MILLVFLFKINGNHLKHEISYYKFKESLITLFVILFHFLSKIKRQSSDTN